MKYNLLVRKLHSIEDKHITSDKIKGITNWYFGLETAIKMNGLTHEFFAVDLVS